ncbi:MAG TPA: DUF488 family protein [Thermoanaerobaculia bacterium]
MENQIRIVTIGVYGFDEEGFFLALTNAGVDTFCDVRRRRGLRGSTYAFANSRRLQDRLATVGIRYVHVKELAPSHRWARGTVERRHRSDLRGPRSLHRQRQRVRVRAHWYPGRKHGVLDPGPRPPST